MPFLGGSVMYLYLGGSGSGIEMYYSLGGSGSPASIINFSAHSLVIPLGSHPHLKIQSFRKHFINKSLSASQKYHQMGKLSHNFSKEWKMPSSSTYEFPISKVLVSTRLGGERLG